MGRNLGGGGYGSGPSAAGGGGSARGRFGCRVYRRLVLRKVAQAALDPLMECGLLVEREAKRSMRSGGGKTHEPSPPGTPPHVQTGALRSSVATAPVGLKTVIVGSIEWYGRVHEYGGRFHPKRPFMRPALLRVMSKFASKFRGLRVR